MAEPTALRLNDNQPFPDQLGYAVHQTAVQMVEHLKGDLEYAQEAPSEREDTHSRLTALAGKREIPLNQRTERTVTPFPPSALTE
eukprot:scaffold144502_cov41-Attheya_sp.AAC.1